MAARYVALVPSLQDRMPGRQCTSRETAQNTVMATCWVNQPLGKDNVYSYFFNQHIFLYIVYFSNSIHIWMTYTKKNTAISGLLVLIYFCGFIQFGLSTSDESDMKLQPSRWRAARPWAQWENIGCRKTGCIFYPYTPLVMKARGYGFHFVILTTCSVVILWFCHSLAILHEELSNMFDVLLFVEGKHTIPLFFRKSILNVIPTSFPKSSRGQWDVECGRSMVQHLVPNLKPSKMYE